MLCGQVIEASGVALGYIHKVIVSWQGINGFYVLNINTDYYKYALI